MSSIANRQFISLTGPVSLFATRVQTDVRNGRNDAIRRDLGKRANPTQLQSVETFNDRFSAEAAKREYANLVGSFQPMQYNKEAYNNVFIADITCSPPLRHEAATDGTNYRLEATWTIQPTE